MSRPAARRCGSFVARALVAATLALVPSIIVVDAAAHPPTVHIEPTKFSWSPGWLRADLSFHGALGRSKALTSGAPVVIATRIYVFRVGSSTPETLAVQRCTVTWNAWDEVYQVQMTMGGPTPVTTRIAASERSLARLCAQADALPIVARSTLTAGDHYFAAIVVDIEPAPALDTALQAWVSGPITAASPLYVGYDALLVRPAVASVASRFVTSEFVP